MKNICISGAINVPSFHLILLEPEEEFEFLVEKQGKASRAFSICVQVFLSLERIMGFISHTIIQVSLTTKQRLTELSYTFYSYMYSIVNKAQFIFQERVHIYFHKRH